MAAPTQPYKGARDFYPTDKRLQKFIFGKWRDVVEKFGYEEYDAPILEPTELFLVKGNQEIIDEQTYTFLDRGERSVTIRTEMTPSVSRMVAAKRQELAYPLRWYSIPNLWRYERPQRGRMREFWQLNVDLFGVPGMEAEHEMIVIVDNIMRAFKAKPNMYTIKLNSRKLVDSIMRDYLKLDDVQSLSLSRLIDKKLKVSHAEFIAQVDAICSPSQREHGVVDRLLSLLEIVTINELPKELKSHSSVAELRQLVELLANSNITNVEFDITLMRGFDYYTDIVFEVFDTHPDNNRSMLGGGRYDSMVALFGAEPIPTVGFGWGDVTLVNFLQLHNLIPKNLPPSTDTYVIMAGEVYPEAQKVLADLRKMGLNVAVDMSGRKLGNQIKSAEKNGIDYVIIVGKKELDLQQYTLRNLRTGTEGQHSVQRIVSIVKDYRRKRN